MIARSDEAMRGICLQTDIPFSGPPLLPGDVHIWWAFLDQLGSRLQKFEQVLAEDEKARAKRFRFERDRNRFIAAHGVLREILECYLGVGPNTIRFVYGKNGKPRIADKYADGHIEFSLSHSEGVALYGFCRDHPIGADIEHIREFPEMDQIAGQFFSKEEEEVLRSLHGSEKVNAFFKCWTRKEALTKAMGVGLSYPLDSLDASVDPNEPAELLGIDGGSGKAARWQIYDVDLAPGFAGCCAFEGRNRQIHHGQWPA